MMFRKAVFVNNLPEMPTQLSKAMKDACSSERNTESSS